MAQKVPPQKFIEIVEHTPLVSIDLIPRDQSGRVLVGRRTNAPAKNTWFVPGGRICKNERISDAFERISREELGVALAHSAGTFRGVWEHLYDDNFYGRPNVGTHYIVLAFEVPLNITIADLPTDQHGHYQWMTLAELLNNADVHLNTRNYFNSAVPTAGR